MYVVNYIHSYMYVAYDKSTKLQAQMQKRRRERSGPGAIGEQFGRRGVSH